MSLYAILVYNKDYKLKHLSYDVKHFSYFERWGLETLANTIIKKCESDSYQITEHYGDKELVIYINFYNIIITDIK